MLELTVVDSSAALDAHGAAADNNATAGWLLRAEVVNGQGDGAHDAPQADVQQVPGGLLEVAIGVDLGAKVVCAGADTGIGAVGKLISKRVLILL